MDDSVYIIFSRTTWPISKNLNQPIWIFFHVILVFVVVNFSHFRHLLQNHGANLNQTWLKVSLGKGESSFIK